MRDRRAGEVGVREAAPQLARIPWWERFRHAPIFWASILIGALSCLYLATYLGLVTSGSLRMQMWRLPDGSYQGKFVNVNGESLLNPAKPTWLFGRLAGLHFLLQSRYPQLLSITPWLELKMSTATRLDAWEEPGRWGLGRMVQVENYRGWTFHGSGRNRTSRTFVVPPFYRKDFDNRVKLSWRDYKITPTSLEEVHEDIRFPSGAIKGERIDAPADFFLYNPASGVFYEANGDG